MKCTKVECNYKFPANRPLPFIDQPSVSSRILPKHHSDDVAMSWSDDQHRRPIGSHATWLSHLATVPGRCRLLPTACGSSALKRVNLQDVRGDRPPTCAQAAGFAWRRFLPAAAKMPMHDIALRRGLMALRFFPLHLCNVCRFLSTTPYAQCCALCWM